MQMPRSPQSILSTTHSSISVSQFTPSKPVPAQRHWYRPIKSTHSPPFWHGDDSHSLMSISQKTPAYPKLHVHTGDAPAVKQNPPFLHGSVLQNGSLQRGPYSKLNTKSVFQIPAHNKMPVRRLVILRRWTVSITICHFSFKFIPQKGLFIRRRW